MSSDHLTPWSERQGQSGFAWAWLGAALQATQSIPFGVITVPSGWRYHPVITAQDAATVAEMFSGRFPWMAVGSGQAMNEHVTGQGWPSKRERNERLQAAVEIIRDLWSGGLVSREGHRRCGRRDTPAAGRIRRGMCKNTAGRPGSACAHLGRSASAYRVAESGRGDGISGNLCPQCWPQSARIHQRLRTGGSASARRNRLRHLKSLLPRNSSPSSQFGQPARSVERRRGICGNFEHPAHC